MINDVSGGRWIRTRVLGSFDVTACAVILSGSLRETCARGSAPPPVRGEAYEAYGSWPELVELASAHAS